jgi:hypothetical protein
MRAMANRAYLSVWTKGYSEEVMLEQFERFLQTVPLSKQQPGFTNLLVRAVSPSEAPVAEHDLQGVIAGATEVAALTREHRNADSAYEVECFWDVWLRDPASGMWARRPAPLLLICNGQAYDDGVAASDGHFVADVGFEYLLTGHARLLGSSAAYGDAMSGHLPEDPIEAELLVLMSREESREEYREKTRANIQQLLAWVRAVEDSLPVDRYRIWSEGEDNFEARIDEILAVG